MNLEPGVRHRDDSLSAPEPGKGIRRLRAQAQSGETLRRDGAGVTGIGIEGTAGYRVEI